MTRSAEVDRKVGDHWEIEFSRLLPRLGFEILAAHRPVLDALNLRHARILESNSIEDVRFGMNNLVYAADIKYKKDGAWYKYRTPSGERTYSTEHVPALGYSRWNSLKSRWHHFKTIYYIIRDGQTDTWLVASLEDMAAAVAAGQTFCGQGEGTYYNGKWVAKCQHIFWPASLWRDLSECLINRSPKELASKAVELQKQFEFISGQWPPPLVGKKVLHDFSQSSQGEPGQPGQASQER